jgi:hypothetical protein
MIASSSAGAGTSSLCWLPRQIVAYSGTHLQGEVHKPRVNCDRWEGVELPAIDPYWEEISDLMGVRQLSPSLSAPPWTLRVFLIGQSTRADRRRQDVRDQLRSGGQFGLSHLRAAP